MRRNLSCYCLLAPRIYILVLHAHPIGGESHNQRNTTGEVATASAGAQPIRLFWSDTDIFALLQPQLIDITVQCIINQVTR